MARSRSIAIALTVALATEATLFAVLLRYTDLTTFGHAQLLAVTAVPVWLVAVVLFARLQLTPRRATVLVLGVSALLQLVALTAKPSSSDDAYRYVWDGKVQLSGWIRTGTRRRRRNWRTCATVRCSVRPITAITPSPAAARPSTGRPCARSIRRWPRWPSPGSGWRRSAAAAVRCRCSWRRCSVVWRSGGCCCAGLVRGWPLCGHGRPGGRRRVRRSLAQQTPAFETGWPPCWWCSPWSGRPAQRPSRSGSGHRGLRRLLLRRHPPRLAAGCHYRVAFDVFLSSRSRTAVLVVHGQRSFQTCSGAGARSRPPGTPPGAVRAATWSASSGRRV